MIVIISKKDGFRRCGIAHTVEPVGYEEGFFSAEQLRQLEAEPMLTVGHVATEELTGDDQEAGKGKRTKSAKEAKADK